MRIGEGGVCDKYGTQEIRKRVGILEQLGTKNEKGVVLLDKDNPVTRECLFFSCFIFHFTFAFGLSEEGLDQSAIHSDHLAGGLAETVADT